MTQFGGFSVVLVADIIGTLNDLSIYCKKSPTPLDFGLVDVTAFVAGGGRNTVNMKHASVASNLQLTMLIDLNTAYIAEQIVGLSTGVTIQLKLGRNAPPGQGDLYWTGTYTLMSTQADCSAGQKEATELWDFEPSDVGNTGIIPHWATE